MHPIFLIKQMLCQTCELRVTEGVLPRTAASNQRAMNFLIPVTRGVTSTSRAIWHNNCAISHVIADLALGRSWAKGRHYQAAR
jgi:hypothetical protein